MSRFLNSIYKTELICYTKGISAVSYNLIAWRRVNTLGQKNLNGILKSAINEQGCIYLMVLCCIPYDLHIFILRPLLQYIL